MIQVKREPVLSINPSTCPMYPEVVKAHADRFADLTFGQQLPRLGPRSPEEGEPRKKRLLIGTFEGSRSLP
jgi:hypothetical protein